MENNNNKTNGWAEWSKYVLKELERLNNSYDNLRNDLNKARTEDKICAAHYMTTGEIAACKIDKTELYKELKDIKDEIKSIHSEHTEFHLAKDRCWSAIEHKTNTIELEVREMETELRPLLTLSAQLSGVYKTLSVLWVVSMGLSGAIVWAVTKLFAK